MGPPAIPIVNSLWGEQRKLSRKRVIEYYFLLFLRIFKKSHNSVTFIRASQNETQKSLLTLATILAESIFFGCFLLIKFEKQLAF